MIEQSLAEFRENFGKTAYPVGNKLFPLGMKSVGELFIPNDWLFKADISDDAKETVIDTGRVILNALPSWLFVRTSWTQYLFLSMDPEEKIQKVVNDRISELSFEVPHVRWWHAFTRSVDEKACLTSDDIMSICDEFGSQEKPLNNALAPAIKAK